MSKEKLSSLNVLDLVKEQDKKWVKVEHFEFLYKKLGRNELFDIVTAAEKRSSKDKNLDNGKVISDVLVGSIIDWKNVKLKDLIDDDVSVEGYDVEEEVEFSKELFEIFLRENFSLFPAINSAVSESIVKKTEKVDKTKKK